MSPSCCPARRPRRATRGPVALLLCTNHHSRGREATHRIVIVLAVELIVLLHVGSSAELLVAGVALEVVGVEGEPARHHERRSDALVALRAHLERSAGRVVRRGLHGRGCGCGAEARALEGGRCSRGGGGGGGGDVDGGE